METAKHKQMFRVIKGNDFSSREEWTRNYDDMSRNCLKHFFQNALAYGEMIVITLNTVCRATVWTLETVSYAKNPQKRKKKVHWQTSYSAQAVVTEDRKKDNSGVLCFILGDLRIENYSAGMINYKAN